MHDFFISYNRADRQWAEWIAWQLEESGYTTVIQAWDFRAGGNFVLDMHDAAAQSERTIAVLSPDYLASQFTHPEWAAAFARDPTGDQGLLLPVRVRECELKGLLPQIVYIDLVGAVEAEAEARLLNGVKRGRAKPTTEPRFPVPDSASSPAERAITVKPRFPGALPPVWNVPHQRNPHFVGRDALLDVIHSMLTAANAVGLTVIHGLGGVGKTQLATEYAYRHAAAYDTVWWVRAEETTTLAADVAALAAKLNLPEQDAREQPVIVEAVRRALNSRAGWLLIFDNAHGMEDLRDYLPGSRTGHVLITSRDPNWGRLAPETAVSTLAPQDATQFLLERTGQSNETVARRLAEELGCLPLALEQAAAYMEAADETLAGYVELFLTQRQELWAEENPPTDYPTTIGTTWEIAFQQAQQQSAAATDLLRLCAFLAPDAIPLPMLRAGARHLPGTLASALSNNLTLNRAITALRRYSLIAREEDSLSVHRLVQAVTRDRLADNERKIWVEAAAKVVDEAFPSDSDDVRTWPVCAGLLPHALAAAKQGEALKVATKEMGQLLGKAAAYYWGRAQYAEAQQAAEGALRIEEAMFGPDHPDVVSSLNNLGVILSDIGKLEEARHYYERALHIDESTFGPDHPNVARNLNNLGVLLKDLNHLDEARRHYERALHIKETAYGPHHPDVAISVINLGVVLKDLGVLDEAREYCERGLKIFESHLGQDHPRVATALNNLGGVLHRLDRLEEERQCYERALRIDEAAFGPDHPNVALDVNNLGGVLKDLGRRDEARQYCERGLRIFTAFLGENHPQTVLARNNLDLLG